MLPEEQAAAAALNFTVMLVLEAVRALMAVSLYLLGFLIC
jgi:hypothetical protein